MARRPGGAFQPRARSATRRVAVCANSQRATLYVQAIGRREARRNAKTERRTGVLKKAAKTTAGVKITTNSCTRKAMLNAGRLGCRAAGISAKVSASRPPTTIKLAKRAPDE